MIEINPGIALAVFVLVGLYIVIKDLIKKVKDDDEEDFKS